MPAARFSLFRAPKRLVLGLLSTALVCASYFLFMPPHPLSGAVLGPAYDLIFGVNTFDPNRQTNVVLGPYILDGTLYLEASKLPTREGTVSTAVLLYRYESKTDSAQPLPMPGPSELLHLQGKQHFVFSPTKQLTLDTNETSPDGYRLAEPEWVKVGPLRNALGNIALFALSGHFSAIKECEQTPRLVTHAGSMAMRAEQPLFGNEGDNAFFLGWVMPDSTASEHRPH